MNLWHFLAATAARHPSRPALQQGHRCVDYGATLRLAQQLGNRIQQRGVKPGDRVACLMPNTIEHYLAYHAVAAVGAILVSLNTRLSVGELQQILRHSGSSLLLHDGSSDALVGQLAATTPTMLVAAGSGDEDTAPFVATPAEADAPAQLYYTSGTTGLPKGVVLTHRNVCTHALTAIRELSLSDADRWAHIAPMFHLADAWATFALTAVGGAHVFLPAFTPAAALDLLVDARITVTNLVPTMLNLMVKQPDAALRAYSLRVMLSGGAPIAPAVVAQILSTFRCDYVQTYGMTETSPYLTLSLLDDELRRLPPEQQLRWKCRTGRAFGGIDLRIVDPSGQPVPPDDTTVGEIRVRGATVTPGYWQDPVATAAAFDADGFLRTGDLATIDRHGSVNIVDRQKDVIKTGGETVYSTEVEHVLYQHAAVLECAVFGRPDPIWGERVCAAVVLRPAAVADAAELIAFCRDRISHYKAPREVRFLTALPKTGSGKIQKRLLRDP